VVALVAEGADVATVACATSDAAVAAIQGARQDSGVVHIWWLLTQLAEAARQAEFEDALQEIGLDVSARPEICDLVGAFGDAADRHFLREQGRSDFAEMAQLAAVESLTSLLGQHAASLYETTPSEVRTAARKLSTKAGFSQLAHEYFSRFIHRFLTYHL